MLTTKIIVLVHLLSISTIADSSRILAIYPIFVRSHFTFCNAVMKSLHKAGHHITFINPFPPEQKIENFTVIEFSNVDEPIFSSSSIAERIKLSRIIILRELLEWDLKDCIHTLNMEFIQEVLKHGKIQYDVIFVNLSIKTWECFVAIAQVVDLPVIGLITNKSWREVELFMGNPSNPATQPHEFCSLSNTKTFVSRLSNLWCSLVDDLHGYWAVQPAMDEVYSQYFPSISVQNVRRPSLIFTNGHPVLLPRPLIPNMVEIGGIHVFEEEAALPKKLKKFLEEAPHGVVLFTLGTMLDGNSLPEEVLNSFISVFAKIPQRVIWKLNKRIENLPKNVLTQKWIPQNAVLAHKNVVAFITHCGISGLYEAIYYAKPLVMVPAHFDQISNAKIMEDFDVGIRLDLLTLYEDLLFEALNSVVNNITYKQKMEVLSEHIRDRPMVPQKAAVYWTEYVIRHNRVQHLQTVAADMPLYQYFILDVLAFLVVITLLVFFGVYKIIPFQRRIYSKNE